MPAVPSEPVDPDLPATSYAVLGLLSFGEELSGYDLKMWSDWTIRFFYWSPSFSQIYSHLKRLESLGYVRSRTVESASARDRRLYSITDEGLTLMRRWAATAPLDPPVLKHSLLLRVWLGHLAEPARLEQLLTEHLDDVRQLATNAEARRQGAVRGAWAYPEIALRWARRYYEAEAALAEALLADLRELAERPVDATGHLAARSHPDD
ncbi:PadR family transcriptional regulator [Micromonospora sp. NPDC050200]|uniref:PadR family transcriptional regulator n=1 Tax=Micromonospora sp. NPDC050200 TaxID=3155664 RepID=UPI0033DBAF5D